MVEWVLYFLNVCYVKTIDYMKTIYYTKAVYYIKAIYYVRMGVVLETFGDLLVLLGSYF